MRPARRSTAERAFSDGDGSAHRSGKILVFEVVQSLGEHVREVGDGLDLGQHVAVAHAVLDETDYGLDIDALRNVADGVNALRGPGLIARVQLVCAAAVAPGGLLRPVLTASGLGMIGILAGGFVLLRRMERRA